MWYLYIIKQREKFYTPITTDLKNRLNQHGKPPLLYKEHFQNKHQAALNFLSLYLQKPRHLLAGLSFCLAPKF